MTWSNIHCQKYIYVYMLPESTSKTVTNSWTGDIVLQLCEKSQTQLKTFPAEEVGILFLNIGVW